MPTVDYDPSAHARAIAAIRATSDCLIVPHEEGIDPRFTDDVTSAWHATPRALLRPASTNEVSAVVAAACQERISCTALGGNTGVVGGSYCDGGFLLSLDRMNRIEAIDTSGMTMTVEAGATLEHVQDAALQAGCFFPVDINARGSATIGGMIATNAGGNRVFRFGMMREAVLGLEAVLADGTIISSLARLLKDNAGYNWKQLLVGSEGTLAIVTRAVLRLRPTAATTQTALVAIPDAGLSIEMLRALEARLAGGLTSAELMWRDYFMLACSTLLKNRGAPLPYDYPVYAIVEMMGGDPVSDPGRFETALAELLDCGLIADAVIAKSERDRKAFWSLREDGTQAFRTKPPRLSFDVSVPVSEIPRFVQKACQLLSRTFPTTEQYVLGHAGDGNLHLVVTGLENGERAAAERAVYDLTQAFEGSIAAEHGIGMKRRAYLTSTRSEEEVALMRTLKRALDPHNILNPGKIF